MYGKKLEVFRFSKLEEILIKRFSHEPQTVADLAQSVQMPRTSLYRPLVRLEERGLVETIKIGKRHYWRKVSEKLPTVSLDGFLEQESSNKDFLVHSGSQNLMRLYEQLADTRNARIYGIQPNKATKSVLNTFPFERLVILNERIKKQKVIIEAVVQEDFVPFYFKLLKEKGVSIKKILKAFEGRMASTTYVHKELIDFDSEITIFRSKVCIFNWKNLTAIEIRHQETIGLFRGLFLIIKSGGRKVDQNRIVRGYLEEEN